MQPPTIPQNLPQNPSGSPLPAVVEPPVNEVKTSQRQRDGWRSAVSTVLILIAAPLIAILLTAFVFQSYEVDGPSMETSLQNHDRLIVYKLSRTWARITKHNYIPQRGDVVIFVKRGLNELDGNKDKQLIKRVIGLPGDRVVVNNGKITIYNSVQPDGYNPDVNVEWSSSVETTGGNVDITIPSGEIFVCGDNRSNSLDSRTFGTVPASDIVGKLAVRILPLGKLKAF